MRVYIRNSASLRERRCSLHSASSTPEPCPRWCRRMRSGSTGRSCWSCRRRTPRSRQWSRCRDAAGSRCCRRDMMILPLRWLSSFWMLALLAALPVQCCTTDPSGIWSTASRPSFHTMVVLSRSLTSAPDRPRYSCRRSVLLPAPPLRNSSSPPRWKYMRLSSDAGMVDALMPLSIMPSSWSMICPSTV